MIKCEQCKKQIDYVITNRFNYDGSDSDIKVFLHEYPESSAIYLETDSYWCGFGLDKKDQIEYIKCPHCKKFPFKLKEVQVEELIRVVMFKTEEVMGND